MTAPAVDRWRCLGCRAVWITVGLQCEACQAGKRPAVAPESPTAPDQPSGKGATRDAARAAVSEAEEQAAGLALLAARGWWTRRVGQRDARGTQDEGVPDVYAIHPEHGALWWEAKRPHGGRLSAAQQEFRARCVAAGVAHVWGATPALREWLDTLTTAPAGAVTTNPDED